MRLSTPQRVNVAADVCTVRPYRMPRSDRTFPVGPRLLALVVALAALLVSVPGAGAQTGPSASDVDNAQQEYQDAIAKLQSFQAQIAAKQQELATAIALLDRAQSELAETQRQIIETRARIDDATARYERIRARLSERTAQAFMSGGNSDLEVVLGATSLDNLSDRLEFLGAIAGADADLAHQAANLRASLEFDEQTLEQLEAEQQDKVDKQAEYRDQVAAALQAVSDLRNEAAAYAEQKLSDLHHVRKQHQDYMDQLAQQAQQVTTTSPPHPDVPLPEGFKNPLEVCPVDDPRAFGDGFGAPRYTGHFHLHAGVDIMANYGTPIRAPFDGVAEKAYNTLGGNSEYVRAPDGSYVYNAHLQSYSAHSSGPVKAGEIIGYVGDTGDATGSPHDHFEWHPAVIPDDWPPSSYGYTVVGPTDAVNPYPILVDVCG
jgi:murein DD-endopeptidase MepM/ murein hydrolase activator NlpD